MAITITQRPRETTFTDGRGRRAVVRNESGQHFLISEVHRGEGISRKDETLVFPCNEVGDITSGLRCGVATRLRTSSPPSVADPCIETELW